MPEIMFIEQIFPAVVADKSTLLERLFAEGKARGLSREIMKVVVSVVPEALIKAGAFLDKMTTLWRYEFGVPYDIAENLVWGTHMWAVDMSPINRSRTSLEICGLWRVKIIMD
jgi:hypothetical protein